VTTRLLKKVQRQDGSHDDSKQAILGKGVGEQPPLLLCRHGRNNTSIVLHALA
jgi:hypothetical protein